MTKKEFIQAVAERLELTDATDLTIDTNIKELDEWNSWNALELMTFVDETFDVNLTADNIKEISTFQSIIEIIGEDKFD